MNRTANYCAFYVDEPCNETNLGVISTKDYCYYNSIKLFKIKDPSFPFVNAHSKTYDVRDDSDWETTLKPRLHQRLSVSKNIILLLSSRTKNSRALREEIEYGCLVLNLPLIVVYVDFDNNEEINDGKNIRAAIKKMWKNLPILEDAFKCVPSLHIPLNKDVLKNALNNDDFMVQNKNDNDTSKYFY